MRAPPLGDPEPKALERRPAPARPMKSHKRNNAELAAAFLRWLEAQRYSPHTRRAYQRILRDFEAFLGAKSFTAVEHFDIRIFLADRVARGSSPSTLRQALFGLRTFYDFLGLGGVMAVFPARLIRTRKVPKRLPRWLTPQQVDHLIGATKTLRDRALIELIYATGCRVGEVVRMRVEDIDWQARTIRVIGKGNKERIVLFGTKAAEALRMYLGARSTGRLFEQLPSHKPRIEKPLDPRRILTIVAEAALRAGLGKVWPHVLRHSFATAMLSGGADIRSVQELLGHASISTTQIYTHVAVADMMRTHQRCHPRS